jgi:hypothetical protein
VTITSRKPKATNSQTGLKLVYVVKRLGYDYYLSRTAHGSRWLMGNGGSYIATFDSTFEALEFYSNSGATELIEIKKVYKCS